MNVIVGRSQASRWHCPQSVPALRCRATSLCLPAALCFRAVSDSDLMTTFTSPKQALAAACRPWASATRRAASRGLKWRVFCNAS